MPLVNAVWHCQVVVLVGAAGEWIDDIKAKAEAVLAGKNDKDQVRLFHLFAAKARVEHLIGTGVEEGASLLDGRGITVEGLRKATS